MVGKSAVGKTSLVITYMKGIFPKDVDSTIGAAQNTKKVKIDDKLIDLQIWDTAGAERYRSLLPIYSRGAHIALVCFETPNLKEIIEQVNIIKKDAPDIHIILVATKMDSEFEYEYTEMDEYVHANNYDIIYTSALKNKNVTETFDLSARKGFDIIKNTTLKELAEPIIITIDSNIKETGYGYGCCHT